MKTFTRPKLEVELADRLVVLDLDVGDERAAIVADARTPALGRCDRRRHDHRSCA
jgi:hypothetical protein